MENESQYINLPHKSSIKNNNSQSLSLFTLERCDKAFNNVSTMTIYCKSHWRSITKYIFCEQPITINVKVVHLYRLLWNFGNNTIWNVFLFWSYSLVFYTVMDWSTGKCRVFSWIFTSLKDVFRLPWAVLWQW